MWSTQEVTAGDRLDQFPNHMIYLQDVQLVQHSTGEPYVRGGSRLLVHILYVTARQTVDTIYGGGDYLSSILGQMHLHLLYEMSQGIFAWLTQLLRTPAIEMRPTMIDHIVTFGHCTCHLIERKMIRFE